MPPRVPSAQLRTNDPATRGQEGFLGYVRKNLPEKADKKLAIHTSIATTTHTLTSSAVDGLTRFTHASGCTITVNARVFTAGQVVQLVGTAAVITLAEGSDVTINTAGTLLSRAAWSPIALYCLSDDGDEFLLMGDIGT